MLDFCLPHRSGNGVNSNQPPKGWSVPQGYWSLRLPRMLAGIPAPKRGPVSTMTGKKLN